MSTAGMSAALSNEWLKARRSRVPLVTFLVLAIGPLAGGLFIYIVADPQRAKDLGLLGQKAQVSGITADWPGLLMFATQMAAAGSLMLFAFILTWLFGREFVDGTAHYLMALPVSRNVIVTAKFILFAAWAALLGVWLTALTFGVGLLMRLPGWSASLAVDSASGIMRAIVPDDHRRSPRSPTWPVAPAATWPHWQAPSDSSPWRRSRRSSAGAHTSPGPSQPSPRGSRRTRTRPPRRG